VFHLRGCEPGAGSSIVVGVAGEERSEKMLNLETVYGDLGPAKAVSEPPSQTGGQNRVPFLVAREALAAVAREQEQAAIEAEDVLAQADEALVMG